MLYLVGTGISFDLTVGALEELKGCDEVYLEKYTNPIPDDRIAALERAIGRKISVIGREAVEGDFLVKRAEKAEVALLASGDPLTATTHITLIIDAKKKGIGTRIIHNSSVYTAAAGKAGLQIYRFGKTATLVNPKPGYRPTSSLDVIRQNLSLNMHTLVLLDTEPEPMEAGEALAMLSEFGSAVVLSRLGEKDEKITYGSITTLKNAAKSLGKPPFPIIIPAKLHPLEEEYLAMLGKESPHGSQVIF